jgi:hypothetical protein
MDMQTGFHSAPTFIPQPMMPPAAMRPPGALRTEGVVLHHLRTPAQVSCVLPLRDEIDLSVHAAAGPQSFATLEKKETSWGSCSRSSLMATSSGRSASSPWATASH